MIGFASWWIPVALTIALLVMSARVPADTQDFVGLGFVLRALYALPIAMVWLVYLVYRACCYWWQA